MGRSATRNLVVVLGIVLLALDVVQDAGTVQRSLAVNGWTARPLGEIVAVVVRNLLLFAGLVLVLMRKHVGWSLLGIGAVFALIRRGTWLLTSTSVFDSLGSPAFQGAFSAADLIFRLLCLAVLVDLIRASHDSAVESTRQMQFESEPFDGEK